MKRTIEHIYELPPAEVVEAFRWYLTYKQLRMPDDDKRCEVSMRGDNGATVKFTEEVEERSAAPGEMVWESRDRLTVPTDG